MMTLQPVENSTPWYRQFWPWFLLTIPLLTIVAGIITIYLANKNQVSLVHDNYYKQGLAINQVMQQQEYAATAKLAAQLTYKAEQQLLSVKLQGKLDHWPQQLLLRTLHPTRAEQDRTFILEHNENGLYTCRHATLPNVIRRVLLSSPDKKWRIESVAPFNTDSSIHLLPYIN